MSRPNLRYRVRAGLVLLVVLLVVLSWAHQSSSGGGVASATRLRSVATTFNQHYQDHDDAAVWELFDATSRRVITESRYVRWHQECPSAPGVGTTLDVRELSGGWWVVDYEISGVTLHDYWHREGGQWRFSLVRSNPSAAKLYASSFAAYARATGCSRSPG